MSRRTLALIALTPLALIAAGCATPTPDATAKSAPAAGPLSLSSGDALGRTLFNDQLALAPVPASRQPIFAEVPSR